MFLAKIDGESINNFSTFDNVKTFKERKEYTESQLMDGEFMNHFFEEYFSNFYKAVKGQTDTLSEQDNICTLLDRYGTYLLESNDIVSNRKVEYRFWKDKREFDKYLESESVNESTLNKEDNGVDVIDMFVDRKNNRNQKIVENTKIKAIDIRDIKEIKALQDAIMYLKSEGGKKSIQNYCNSIIEKVDERDKVRINYIINNIDYYVNKYCKTLRDNQVMIKEAIKKPIVFKEVLKDEGFPTDWSKVDMGNKEHVKELLRMLAQRNLMSENDLGLVLWDLHRFIEKGGIKLSKREKEMFLLLSNGYELKEIEYEMHITQQAVSKTLNNIAMKITKTSYTVD